LNRSAFQHNEEQFLYSQVNIFFKEDQFLASHRSELYGTTEFLGTCGGIMGLCLGVSVMSLCEIVYFFTIRLWFDLRKDTADVPIEMEILPRTGRPGMLTLIKALVAEYSRKTTMQGIKYLADTNLSIVERICWTILVVVSTIGCGSLIAGALKHYELSPMIVSYANEETSISQVYR
jgi:Amiloride-sensitive sodium channel